MKTDCNSLIDSMKSLRVQATEKRLCGEIWALREAISSKEISSMDHVPTGLMIADGLTKIQPKLRIVLLQACAGHIPIVE